MWRDSLTFSEVSWLLSEVSQTSPCLFDALNLFLAQANKKTNKKKPESFIRLHPPIAADTVPAGRLSRCHDLLGLLNTTEPSLMLLGTPFFNRDKRKVHLVWHHPAAATLTWDRRLSLSNKRWKFDLQTFRSTKDNQTEWLTAHVWVWEAFTVVCVLKLLLATAFFFFFPIQE